MATTIPASDWSKADKEKLMPLAKELRSSTATRSAVYQSATVSYIKGNKFLDHLTANNQRQADEANEIGNAFLRAGLFVKTDIADKTKKWLRPAEKAKAMVFEPEFFYVWTFEGPTTTRNIYLTILIGCFFGLVLFPVWPQFAKVGVWYVSMTLLLFLTGFIVLRLFLFLFLYGIGIDFWILPNFFADDLGFFDSFKPVYTLTMWNQRNIAASWPYRLAMLLGLLAFAYWVATQPTEFDVFVAQQRAFVDELYEGTLLSDKAQKEKDHVDRTVPDVETLKKELEELERQEAAQKAKLDAMINDAIDKQEKEVDDDDDDDEHPAASGGSSGGSGDKKKQEEFADL